MTISGGSALPKEEIDRMVKDAEAHAEEDKTRREETEARNTAEQLVYSTEKFLGRQRRQDPGRRPRRRRRRARRPQGGPEGRLRRHPRGHRDQVGEARPRSPRSWARRCTPPPPPRTRVPVPSRAAQVPRVARPARRRMTTSSTPRWSRTTRPRTRSDPARRQHGPGAGGAAPRRPARAGDPRQAAARPRDRPGASVAGRAPWRGRGGGLLRRPGRAGGRAPRPTAPQASPRRRASRCAPVEGTEGGDVHPDTTLAAERLAGPAAPAGRVRQLQAAGRP